MKMSLKTQKIEFFEPSTGHQNCVDKSMQSLVGKMTIDD